MGSELNSKFQRLAQEYTKVSVFITNVVYVESGVYKSTAPVYF